MNQLRILVIGTMPPPVGGASVSLQHLVDVLCERDDIQLILINTSGVRGHPFTGPFRFCTIMWRMFILTHRCSVVSLHIAPSGLPIFGPVVRCMARLWKKPLVIRKFGGYDYLAFTGLRGVLARWVVRGADLYLAQTRELMNSGIRDGLKRVEWFPTSRPMDKNDTPSSPVRVGACRRFVFLSIVRPTKGVSELIWAGEKFENNIVVDIYGPFMDGLTVDIFSSLKRVRYRGIAPPGEATSILAQYDALVFPTYWLGEGYPGIIIEAFSAGIPVITTRWKAIQEIVDETCSLLVNPRDRVSLYKAMNTLVEDVYLYRRLCDGARAKRKSFDSRIWTNRFVEYCRELASLQERSTNI